MQGFKKLIVALDIEDRKKIARVIDSLYPHGAKFKIGSVAFTKFGPRLVKGLVKKGIDIFLDLKLYDIPNTMKNTAKIITELGCWAFTVHISAGPKALGQVREEVLSASKKLKVRKPLILGVTELTSRNTDIKKIIKLSSLAESAKIDGVISSAFEAAQIKEKYKKLKVITPGIRNQNQENMDDQKRVATASFALKNGADYIVVGRPIINEKDYVAAAKAILSSGRTPKMKTGE
ncbi:MAG: orotidine-5'-phosphate decarboxylase [Candidatus Omnitrophota bacterium]